MSVLLTVDGEGDETEFGGDEELNLVETTEDEQISLPQPLISLNSVMGITSPKTMKLKGILNGGEVVVMIDPGATHNFISTRAATQLGLLVTSTKKYGVSLGTGEAVQGDGECRGILLVLQGVQIIEDFLLLPLGNSDIILGIQ